MKFRQAHIRTDVRRSTASGVLRAQGVVPDAFRRSLSARGCAPACSGYAPDACRPADWFHATAGLFAADQDAPRHQIGRGIAALEVAIADRMTQTVDHASRPDRNPHHLDGPDGDADDAEQRQRVRVLRLGAIQLGAFAQHGGQPFDDRAVRVIDGFAFGVMLAVDGGPLAGVLRRGQPQPETEKVLEPGVEFERAGDCDQLPDGKVEQTVVPHRLICPRL
nr:hypothetical protein [Tanacetum cinerariifolium]